MPILHPHATRFHEWCISCAFGLRAHWTINRTSPILGFRGATFPKMGDSLPRMPINRRVKFVASAEKSVTVQTHKITNKQVRSSSGTAVYPHMPRANIFDRRQSPSLTDSAPSVEGTGVYRHYLSPRRFVRFWASGEQSSPKWEIPCQWRPWTTLQNLTLLALSYLEKSVTVQKQTNRNKQKQTNSKRYIHTLPIGMCG